MKHFILGNMALLLLTTASVPAVEAQVQSRDYPVRTSTLEMSVTPFDLVFLAYQGFLESEGVPKFNFLITQHREGRLHAERLVQAAINMGRLSPEVLHNRRYLAAVEQQLDSLSGSRNR